MKPLQSLAMGLVVVALAARVRGYDLLADPVGWLLVLHGVVRLPEGRVPRTSLLRGLAVLALLAATVLWFPTVSATLEDADESLLWAANLPQLAFVAALCLSLSRTAAQAEDRAASAWLRTAATLTLVAALLPVVVFGAGRSGLLVPTVVGATLVLVGVIVLLFRYAGRRWAGDGPGVGLQDPDNAAGAAPR